MLRFVSAILLTIAILALGSGWMSYLHLTGIAEGAKNSNAQKTQHPAPTPPHDESTCLICMQLHAPLLAAGWVPLLVCLGLFVAFLTLLIPPPVSRPAVLQLSCRGPPAC